MKNNTPIGSIIKFKSKDSNFVTIAHLVRIDEARFTSGKLPYFITVMTNFESRTKPGEEWCLDLENTHFEAQILGNISTHPEYIL